MPKPKAKKPLWQNFIFIFLLVLFFAGSAGYVFLSAQAKSLQKSNQEIDAAVSALQKQIRKSGLEQGISDVEKTTNDFQAVFAKHKIASNVFGFLREICHKKVQIEKIDVNTADSSANLVCQTENLRDLGEQALILSDNPQVKKFEVSGVSINEKGGVDFNVNLSFDPQIIANPVSGGAANQ